MSVPKPPKKSLFIHCLITDRLTPRSIMTARWLRFGGVTAAFCRVNAATKEIRQLLFYGDSDTVKRTIDADVLELNNGFENIHQGQSPANRNRRGVFEKEKQKSNESPAGAVQLDRMTRYSGPRFYEMTIRIVPHGRHSLSPTFTLSADIAYARLTHAAVKASALLPVQGDRGYKTTVLLSKLAHKDMLRELDRLRQRYQSLRFITSPLEPVGRSRDGRRLLGIKERRGDGEQRSRKMDPDNTPVNV